MPETETAAALGLIDQIAAALGCAPAVVEILMFVCLLVLLLTGVFAVLAIFRIRRELISLNFKIIYIGRLIEQAVKRPEIPAAIKKPAQTGTVTPAPAAPTEASEKFKL